MMEEVRDVDVVEAARDWEWRENGEEGNRERELELSSWHCFSNQSLLKQVSMH